MWWRSCHEQQGARRYCLWVQPIRSNILRTGPGPLAAQMGPGAADISAIIPEVLDKLPYLELSSPLEPEQARFGLFDSISQFLKNVSQSQPMMLVLNNLQWADQPSLLLLGFLASLLSDSKIMLLGTYRDIEVSREHPLSNTFLNKSASSVESQPGLWFSSAPASAGYAPSWALDCPPRCSRLR